MIKGLAITPPVIGRISIGKVVEKNGKRLPEKDDCFTLTTQVQNKDGWMLHPLHQKLLEGTDKEKIRAIPVKLLFNASDLNLRAEYSLFDRTTGRPVCVGNGETAKGVTTEGIKEFACPSPEGCEIGKKGGCKPYGRLNVQVDGQNDELGSFVFRTTGFNSIRTLTARLAYLEAVSDGNSRHLPLMLKLRAKSTTQSHRAPVYYVDLCLRNGVSLEDAVIQAKAEAAKQEVAGINITALESAARSALANGAFEDSEEEIPAIVEEFYPEAIIGQDGERPDVERGNLANVETVSIRPKLSDRLSAKVKSETTH